MTYIYECSTLTASCDSIYCIYFLTYVVVLSTLIIVIIALVVQQCTELERLALMLRSCKRESFILSGHR